MTPASWQRMVTGWASWTLVHLVYSLVYMGGGGLAPPPSPWAAVRRAVIAWAEDPTGPTLLAARLSHAYQGRSLMRDALLATDKELVDLLADLKGEDGRRLLEVRLAVLDRTISKTIEREEQAEEWQPGDRPDKVYGGGYSADSADSDGSDDSDCDLYYDDSEVTSRTTFTHWVSLHGEASSTGRSAFQWPSVALHVGNGVDWDESTFVGKNVRAFDDMDFDQNRYGDPEPFTATHRYRMALVAVWPRPASLRIATEAGLVHLMNHVEQQLAQQPGGGDHHDGGNAGHGSMQAGIPAVQRNKWVYNLLDCLQKGSRLTVAKITRLMRLGTALGSVELVRAAVPRLAGAYAHGGAADQAVNAVTNAVAAWGWSFLRDSVEALLAAATTDDTDVAIGLLGAVGTPVDGIGKGEESKSACRLRGPAGLPATAAADVPLFVACYLVRVVG